MARRKNIHRSELRGEGNHEAKLTKAQVEEIRNAYRTDGRTYRGLGEQYGIAHSHIGRIVRGEKWRNTQA